MNIDHTILQIAKTYPGHDQPKTEEFFSGIQDKYGVRVTDYIGPEMRFTMTMDALRGVIKDVTSEPDNSPPKKRGRPKK